MKSILLTRLTACKLKATTVAIQLFFHVIIHLQKKKEENSFSGHSFCWLIDKEGFQLRLGENPKLVAGW